MKIEWQVEDIKPGRIVGKPDRTEQWMIGYFAIKSKVYALVSMSDGMIREAQSAEEMAAALNSSGEIPIEFFSDPTHSKRGQRGGLARAASLSPERRSEIASKAADARWSGGTNA